MKDINAPSWTFGKNVSDIREFLGMSRPELAKKMGISLLALTQIESGKREPGLKTICKFMQALNVKFERLLE